MGSTSVQWPMATGSIRIKTLVQSWTRVHNPMCLVALAIGQKPDPIYRTSLILETSKNLKKKV